MSSSALAGFVESIAADVGYAIRSLRRRATFTLVAALTLALGIGATSAMFSLIGTRWIASLLYGVSPDDPLVALRIES